ncbi:MAG: single-stranded DNA-binding protein [Acholeplasmatales bacterium]|nr:single-stranded DNA-binding protein [Acholeplasmatales bacterium]
MNRVSLVGRITRDPEVRFGQSGNSVLGFTIAVDRAQRDANGQRQADFINCVAFGQIADFISRYVKKGYMLAVGGRLQTRSYQGADGQQRNVTEVLCDSVENLTPRDPNSQPQNDNQPQQRQYQPNYNNPNQGYNNPTYQQQPEPQYRPQNLQKPAQPDSFDVSDSSDVADDDLPF